MKFENEMERLAKQIRFQPNAEADERILARSQTAMSRSIKKRSAVSRSWGFGKMAAAAAVLILIMVGMYNFTGSIDGASISFANAMEYFVAAQTARFDLSIKFGEQEPQTSSFLYDANGYIRQNMANGIVNFIDYNRNKVISLVPDSNTAVIRDVSNTDFHTALYDIFSELPDLIQQAIDLGQGPVESLGTKTIDGHRAYGYCVETTGQSPGLYWQGKGTLTIWADAETDFPLILKWHNTMTNITVTVSNIHLNEIFTLDEASITIPQGYTIRDETLPPAEPEHEPEEPQAMQIDIIESDDSPETAPEQPQIEQITDSNITDLIEGLEKNEKALIKFFNSFTFLAKGRFPSSLSTDAVKDIDPDAKITFKQTLWSYSISVSFPNLTKGVIADIEPNSLTEEEKEQIKQKKGPIYEEMMAQLNEKFGYFTPHFENIAEGFGVINKLPANSNWHYNGQDTTLGDANAAIFWYKPKDSDIYRVIYGDLTIEDIDPEDIHLLEKPSDEEIDRQANAVLEAAIQLGADIPKDDRKKVFRILSLKEKDLINGLATYLEYSDGRYPQTMILDKNLVKDLDALFSEAINQGLIDKKASEEKVFDLFYATSFYAKLTREKKDPAYYGSTATLSDPNAVLVRWKLSKNKYRVIYTSLKAETVTTEKLAELEKASIPIK